MNKIILIHIGPPKSGTSAIQFALNNCRSLLNEKNIWYPEHEIGQNGISSGNINAILEQDEQFKWLVSETKVSNLLQQFEASSAHTLILSSEYFFYVAKTIAELLPSAKFIAYVRCPLETFESSYNQSVKRHMRNTPIVFGKNLHTTTLNILSETIETIGLKRFILRAYLPSKLEEFDLIQDFCEAAQIPHLPVPRKVTNSSYSFDALEFKRWLNQFGLGNIDAKIDQSLQSYTDGANSFTLLPEDLFIRYQKQALHTTRDFVQKYKVFNGKRLVNFLQSRKASRYLHQSFNPEQIKRIGEYLCQYHNEVFKQICNALKNNPNIPREQLEQINILLSLKNVKRPLFSRIISFFKNGIPVR